MFRSRRHDSPPRPFSQRGAIASASWPGPSILITGATGIAPAGARLCDDTAHDCRSTGCSCRSGRRHGR